MRADDPMSPDLLEQEQRALQNRQVVNVQELPDPLPLDELLRRSQLMLQNIQDEFMTPGHGASAKEARAAVTAAGPLLKLLLEKAPQMTENRHTLFEECVIETLQEADTEYQTAFLARLKEKLDLHSIRLKKG